MNLKKNISRRHFLAYLGTGAASIVSATSGLDALLGQGNTAKAAALLFDRKTASITELGSLVKPTSSDELNLPAGFRYDILAAYGDPINSKGHTFGYDSASAVFIPEEGSSVKGLLYVDHEASSARWAHGERSSGTYSQDQLRQALYNQGASVVAVYRDTEGRWRLDLSSPAARRITGLDPVELTGPVRGTQAVNGAQRVQGTLGNRTAAATLWGTVLTSEGAWDMTCHDAGLDPAHYGWAVEIDPGDPAFMPRKHTALGRFHHSGTEMRLSRDGRIVVYMGDLTAEAPLFKYVSRDTFRADGGRANSRLLTEGTLYAADLVNSRWIELSLQRVQQALSQPGLRLPRSVKYTQEQLAALIREPADVLVYAAEAALVLGASPLDRQGDAVLHPIDGSLYVSHLGSALNGNVHGQIMRLVEEEGDAGALSFDFEITASGGPQSGFSAPGHLAFDRSGKLWIATDIAPDQLNRGSSERYGNNGLYVLQPGKTPTAGLSQFASAPVGAAFASPAFTPDERTLFLSVQHPGEAGGNTSRWPNRQGDTAPRSALAAVRG